jgi:spermidine/putrescine-binding protein
MPAAPRVERRTREVRISSQPSQTTTPSLPRSPLIDRRDALRIIGLTGTAAVLAACGVGDVPSPSSIASASPSPSGPTPSPSPNVGTTLAIYDWTGDVSPDNLDEFGRRFGVTDIRHDSFDDHAVLIETLAAGSSGYDLCCPSAEYLPTLAKEGYIQKLDLERIPNARLIDPAFRKLWWDPDQAWHVPKSYGDTVGVLYRGDTLAAPPRSWKEFDALVRGEASKKTVVVDSMDDVFVYPLKMLGHSLNSVDKKQLAAARKVLLAIAPHVLAVDSDTYGARLASHEAVMALGWTGPLFTELATPATSDARFVLPAEGSLFRADAWALVADAPDLDAAYAWLDFICEPAAAAEESNHSGYATANAEARPLVDRTLLDNPAIYPPQAVVGKLEAARDNSANSQRLDIWEEFKARVRAG